MNSLFEVNQVLNLPANKEYNAYKIEGVQQLSLDNKPAGVKIFISQNSMKQNARELRNRDDGYANLPYPVDLYLFTEGLSENSFIKINYTGNAGSYYKYGNDTIAQVDNILNVNNIKRIESIGNIEKIWGINFFDFLSYIRTTGNQKFYINLGFRMKLGNIYNYQSKLQKINGFSLDNISITEPFEFNVALNSQPTWYTNNQKTYVNGKIDNKLNITSTKIIVNITNIDIDIIDGSWINNKKDASKKYPSSVTFNINLQDNTLTKKLYFNEQFTDYYEYDSYDYQNPANNNNTFNSIVIYSTNQIPGINIFDSTHYRGDIDFISGDTTKRGIPLDTFSRIFLPSPNNRVSIDYSGDFYDENKEIEFKLNGFITV